MTDPVTVPREFRDIGYSGTFWLDVTADAVPMWRRMVPCLLGNSGWMALRVNNDDTVTVVRKDDAAVWEAMTGKPRLAALTLADPLHVDDWVTTPSREASWMTGTDKRVVAHQLHRRGDLRSDLTRCGRPVRGRLLRASDRMPRCRICLTHKERRS